MLRLRPQSWLVGNSWIGPICSWCTNHNDTRWRISSQATIRSRQEGFPPLGNSWICSASCTAARLSERWSTSASKSFGNFNPWLRNLSHFRQCIRTLLRVPSTSCTGTKPCLKTWLLLSNSIFQIVPRTQIKFYAHSLRLEPRVAVLHESPWMKQHINLVPRLLADIDVEAASDALKAIGNPDASPAQMDTALEFIARNLADGIPRGFKKYLIDYVIRAAQDATRRKLDLRALRRQVGKKTLASLNDIAAGRQNVRHQWFEVVAYAKNCCQKHINRYNLC